MLIFDICIRIKGNRYYNKRNQYYNFTRRADLYIYKYLFYKLFRIYLQKLKRRLYIDIYINNTFIKYQLQ